MNSCPPLHTNTRKHIYEHIFNSSILSLNSASHFSNLAPSKGPKLFPTSSCPDSCWCKRTSHSYSQARSHLPRASKGKKTPTTTVRPPQDPPSTPLTWIGGQGHLNSLRPKQVGTSLSHTTALRKVPSRCPYRTPEGCTDSTSNLSSLPVRGHTTLPVFHSLSQETPTPCASSSVATFCRQVGQGARYWTSGSFLNAVARELWGQRKRKGRVECGGGELGSISGEGRARALGSILSWALRLT